MTDLLSSIGGLGLGFLGSLAKGGLALWKSHLDHKHNVEMRKIDLEFMEREKALDLQRSELETNALLYKAQTETLAAAHAGDADTGSAWVEDTKGLVRPVLSFALMSYMGYMTYEAMQLFTMTSEIAYMVIAGVLSAGQAVVAFHFGDRTISRVFDSKQTR